jgi:hypothetical protein
VVGLVVFAVFAGSMIGQAVVQLMPEAVAMPAGCVALIAGMAFVALGLALPAMAPLVLGGVIAGFGHGLSFRAGLAAVNSSAPAELRGEVASSFFVVMYLAISLPVIGVGLLAQVTGLRPAGLIFAAAVAALAGVALVPLWAPARESCESRSPAAAGGSARPARRGASIVGTHGSTFTLAGGH